MSSVLKLMTAAISFIAAKPTGTKNIKSNKIAKFM